MPKLGKVNKQYGGPGVFVPSEESPGHRQQGSGSSYDEDRRNSIPSSILPSNSSMGLDLYKPEYEKTVRGRAQHSTSMERLVNDMGELVVLDSRRRDTFPVRIRCSLLFPYPGLILRIPARLFYTIGIDFRALCCFVFVFANLSGSGKLGPRYFNIWFYSQCCNTNRTATTPILTCKQSIV